MSIPSTQSKVSIKQEKTRSGIKRSDEATPEVPLAKVPCQSPKRVTSPDLFSECETADLQDGDTKQETASGSGLPSTKVITRQYRPPHYEAIWKPVRKDGESKYNFVGLPKPKRKSGIVLRKKATVVIKDHFPEVEPSPSTSLALSPDSGNCSVNVERNANLENDFQHEGSDSRVHTLLDLDDFPIQDNQSVITDLEGYVYLLRTNQAIASCDETLKNFVMQEYDSEVHTLKSRKYIFVSRCGKYFDGEPRWFYWCSCDQRRAEFMDSLSTVTDTSYEEVNALYPECFHCRAAQHVIASIDAIHGLSAELDLSDHTYAAFKSDSGQSIAMKIGNEGAVCLKSSEGFGVIMYSDGGIACTTCKYAKRNCSHIQLLHSISKDDSDDIPRCLLPLISSLTIKSNRGFTQTLYVLSTKLIPFKVPEHLSRVMKQPIKERFHEESGVCSLRPNYSQLHCSKCGSTSWLDEEQCAESLIVTPNEVLKAKVFFKPCNGATCTGISSFDGQDRGLLNMKSFCVSYEVLRSHMFHFLMGRTTIYTEYTVLAKAHEDAGSSLTSHLSYNQYRFAWYSFINLLDIDLSAGFLCQQCGIAPDVVIMDGTSLAFRKELDPWSNLLQDTVKAEQTVKRKRYNDRLFIPHSRTRTLLKQFTATGLHINQYGEMISLLQIHAKELTPLVQLATQINQSVRYSCKKEWAEFLCSLAASSPLCALIHPSERTYKLVSDMCATDIDITKQATLMKCLQEEIPSLFAAVRSSSFYPKKLLQPLLLCLIKIVKETFIGAAAETIPSCSHGEMVHDLSFFPFLPVQRQRRRYEADSNGASVVCTKKKSRHPSLLPGVFTLFCQHGICYGFQVMRVCESPNTPFTILYQRFKSAPKYIIYDNGCNLHAYALNREPNHFKASWFLVDRFHWPNHTGCSSGYNIRLYPQLQSINIVKQLSSPIPT